MAKHSEQSITKHSPVPLWCRDYKKRDYCFDEFLDLIEFFSRPRGARIGYRRKNGGYGNETYPGRNPF